MNARLLYAATIAVSLISTLAMAEQAPLTRAQVIADLQQARADGTLKRTDYDAYRQDRAAVSTMTRAQVGIELADAQAERKTLIGPDADRNYNPAGTRIREVSTLARATVKEEVREAAANGTLQRTDYDDTALLARRAQAHVIAVTRFAARKKAAAAGSVG